ncbi:hypothetical protein GCM10023184_10070 [Flaviaesturariibacter amylovorans]|uniref:histidine kinase n=1 Tax=Flaviaesturariibacter amylovorans TaxID=1084520 RepID=A0ABP8GG15_9BACT
MLLLTLALMGAGLCLCAQQRVPLPKPFYRAAIRDVRFDEAGFLWFATTQGLWRYDGTSVQPFDLAPYGRSLATGAFSFFYYDGLLILADGTELLALDPHTRATWTYPVVALGAHFSIDRQNRLFFVGRKGQAFTFTRREGLREQFPWIRRSPIPRGDVQAYHLDTASGRVYLFSGTSVGIVERDTVRWQPLQLPKLPEPMTDVMQVLQTKHHFLVRYFNGYLLVDRRSLQVLEAFNGHQLGAVLRDGDQFLFFAQPGQENSVTPSSAWCRVAPPLAVESIRQNGQDLRHPQTGTHLIATDKGLFEWRPATKAGPAPPSFSAILRSFQGRSIRGIFRAAGKLYVGTYEGLFVCTDSVCRKITTMITYTIRRTGPNELLLGLEGGPGFATLDTRNDQITMFPFGSATVEPFCLEPMGDGFLAGGRKGLYTIRRSNDRWSCVPRRAPANCGYVRDLHQSDSGLYIATQTGLFLEDAQGVFRKVFPGQEHLMIHAVLPSERGLWLATQGRGLVLLGPGGKVLQEVGMDRGLAGQYVYSLQELDGFLVAGTNGGISVLNGQGEVEVLPTDVSGSDPLFEQEFNHSASYFDSTQDALLLGGVEGLYRLPRSALAHLSEQASAALRIAYVKKGGSGANVLAPDLFAGRSPELVVRPSESYIGIKVGTTVDAGRRTALFRLKERSAAWQPFSLSQDIGFYGLPPGTYTLQVRFSDQVREAQWLQHRIEVKPAFHQTWWFQAALLLLVAGIGYAFWREKVAKMKREQQLRTTIASDLHDEIGSALTRISISSELLSMQPDSPARPVMERISTDSKKAIASISDIIWSIDARNDTGEDLLLRMKEHALNLLDRERFDLSFQASGMEATGTVPQAMRQNLYLIFKEAVNNIARHNAGGAVRIELENGANGFRLSLRNELRPPEGKATAHKGQGLRNMDMRARRIRGRLRARTADNWFSIELEMPRL